MWPDNAKPKKPMGRPRELINPKTVVLKVGEELIAKIPVNALGNPDPKWMRAAFEEKAGREKAP